MTHTHALPFVDKSLERLRIEPEPAARLALANRRRSQPQRLHRILLAARAGGMTKPWYWAGIVAARAAGTTMGDLVARHEGLSLSTVSTGFLLVSILVLWKERRVVTNEA